MSTMAIAVVATLTQGVLLRRLTMPVIVAGLLACGAGAALLTPGRWGSPYAAWVLPGLVLVGAAAVLCGAPIRGGTRLDHEAGQPEPLDEIAGGLI